MTQAATWGVQSTGPASPTAVASRINDSLNAQLSQNRGAARPSYAVAGTIWVKVVSSTVEELYVYGGTSDSLIGTYNPTTGAWVPAIADGSITLAKWASGVLDTDDTLSANSDDKVPSQKAVKAHVAAAVASASTADVKRTYQSAAQATTSGTFKDFLASEVVPVGVTVTGATLHFTGVSTNGSSIQVIQLGTGGAAVSSGYVGSSSGGATSISSALITGGCAYNLNSYAGQVATGSCESVKQPGSTNWKMRADCSRTDGSGAFGVGSCYVPLGGTIDRVRLTTVGGTDTFDAGTAWVEWEGFAS